ncbi:hypothetical protein [Mycolicibacterium peregrinum]|nr:hypothetical protein [Mycolicibacterium peregrinum]
MMDTASAEFARQIERVAAIAGLVAQCALTAAYWTDLYREPGQSISEIDERLGSTSDVEDPLLTAHRFAKFYLISAGDCVDTMTKLLMADYPNLVGCAAVARSAAEHASRSMYLSDPCISYQARLLRTSLLMSNSLREYKSTHDSGATSVIDAWNRWRARTGAAFKDQSKQKLPNATGLIQRYFSGEGTSRYEELSRPTHGNAAWLAITVVQEQKETPVARIMMMRNALFAVRCVVAATVSIASLWQLDLSSVVESVGERGDADTSPTWEEIEAYVRDLGNAFSAIDERQFVDLTADPQPPR